MSRRDCLRPPADGTADREIYDRMADFLRVAPSGPAAFLLESPARRYHVRLLAWRVGQVDR